MMRMMRKMFKRIVSIVMALLVILGTAVYGGSVFAEEQTATTTFTINQNYIYLNPAGMNLGEVDWTRSNADIELNVNGWADVHKGEYDPNSGYWYWNASSWDIKTDNKFFFTYTKYSDYGKDNDNPIKKKPYYRTEMSADVLKKGKVYAQNGTATGPIDGQAVYALKEYTSNAGQSLSFVDMTAREQSGVQAQFSLDGKYDDSTSEQVTDGKVTVPNDVNGNAYQYVRFIDAQSKSITDSFDLATAISKGGVLYYGTVSNNSTGSINSVWSKDKKNSSAPTTTKLYFKQTDFPIDKKDSIKVKIGNGSYENVIVEDNTILSYDLKGKTLSSDTIIEVKKDNIIYRFYPNRNLSLVTIDSDGNAGLSIYRNNPSGTYTVYYDATLSKLSYEGTNDVKNGGKGIPYPKTTDVYYYATNGTTEKYGKMTATGNDEYPDVYKVDLPDGYNQVRFAAYNVQNKNPSQYGDATDLVTIPGNLMNPCYYGDSSDDVIYKGGNRGGYWDEAYTVRDPEKEAEQHNSKDVVDINEGTFTRNASTLYVNSTFYDYYTDYELNGKNRDDYDQNNPAAGSQRSYVTFRQFDQALSNYYENKNVSIPIYTGHFQPNYRENNSDWGNPFSAIAGTLELYGYNKDNQSGFMSTNNSTLDANGKGKYYYSAAQGLVANALSENNLMTSDNNALEPHFNEEFLTGDNSKHTALAKVYKNVSFPFTKQKVDDNGNKNDNSGVEYWYFDSADTTLAMRTDKESGSYYLKDVGHQDWSKNVNSSSKTDGVSNPYGFFPFNETAAKCSASNYNYGFGTKLEFKFRLTDDGSVVGTDEKEHPIKFNFSGDDDVWVYVDGKLALDVGGAHGKVTGQIDFKNKIATVSNTKKSQNESSKEGAFTTSSVEIKGSNSDEHTLTMFYMERGMWESNMKVSFNFPDENEFAVEKKVDTTGVNTELFPTSLFKDASVFPFTIQNQATHYAPKATESSDAKSPKTYNDSFSAEKLSKTSSQNTFETVDSKDGQSSVVHWKAIRDDAEGEYVNQRFGIIQPATGDTFDASETNAFLQFKMYYNYSDTPGLASTYLELEDDDGNKIGGYLSGKTYGNSSLVQKKWNTIQVDLSKLQGDNKFDYSKIKNIKFNYNFERDIYLDDFIFIPSVVAAAKTGFVTQQQEIPDYGSATSGTLKYPEGAQYTLSKKDGSSKLYRIDSDGKFALADGETATFSDQFRRGSYIAVSEDVNSSVFDTTWTLYENGQAVSTMGTGTTVKNEDPIPLVKNVESNTIRDGRKEVYRPGSNGNGVEIPNKGYLSTGYAKNQDSGKTENKNTIVFRSYADPDNQTTMTKLKATFVNKVKTGKIEIRKGTAEGSDKLTNEYTFRVEFSNVADLSLESKKIVKEYTIKAGESVTIEGIPAGTDYRISESNSKDGSTLESVIVNNNNSFDAGYDPVTKVVAGKVIASSDIRGDGIINKDTSTDATIITFNNTLKPTINLNLTKEWKNTEGKGITLPDSIKIRLQRSSDAGKSWETVKYDGTNETITLYQGYDGKWSYPFKDLDQYVNYRADPKVPYIYRVVEVSGDDESETEIESGGYLNDKYKVAYSENVDCSKISTETPESKTQSFTITNTYSPKTNIKIKKQDASTKKPLDGVEFKLEKMKKDTSTNKLVVDDSFKTKSVTTGDSGSLSGIAEFKDLEDGTYRLTETKTVAGYNLLKNPITIKINRNQEDGTTVDGQPYYFTTDENTIELQISNRMKFLLPKTGGYGAMLFILCGMALATLCCLIFFLINLRKEVQYSRHKRQRRNAIGK
ncbi:MAG: SpaA isopeptide-forming pilin-related protein [Agathobacter rectalis]